MIYLLCLIAYLVEPVQLTERHSKCEPLRQIPFGNIRYTGNIARLRCDVGYKPVSITTVFCKPNGHWSNKLGCKAIQCRIPLLPNGKWVNAKETHFVPYHTRLFASCKHGHMFSGTVNSTTCLSDGSWSQHDTKCTATHYRKFCFIVASVCILFMASLLLIVVILILLFRKKRNKNSASFEVFAIQPFPDMPPCYRDGTMNHSQRYLFLPPLETTDGTMGTPDDRMLSYSSAETLPLGMTHIPPTGNRRDQIPT